MSERRAFIKGIAVGLLLASLVYYTTFLFFEPHEDSAKDTTKQQTNEQTQETTSGTEDSATLTPGALGTDELK